MGRWITKNGAHVWIENADEQLHNALDEHYPSMNYSRDVNYITKISGQKALEKEYGELKNRDVVLTDERKNHIIERRGKDANFVIGNIKETINNYDYILKDDDKKAIFIKKIKDTDHHNHLVVYLSLKDKSKANSVITGIKMNDSKVRKKIEKHKIIDKKK